MQEQFQLDIARIVTRARRGTSLTLKCNEINWLTLKEKGELIMLSNFVNSKEVRHQTTTFYWTQLQMYIIILETENITLVTTQTETFRKNCTTCNEMWDGLPLKEGSLEAFQNKLKFQSNSIGMLFEV